MTRPLDWNDVRFFLAVARARTLSRASRALAVDQTTVGRRVASLEAKLGVALFTRAAHGWAVTPAGTGVLEAAERMEEAALELRSFAKEDDSAISGVVRVATTDSLAEAFIVPAARALHARHPRVHVTIATGWARVDLRQGEADLAVRLVRPTDPRLACRKVADFSLRLYASREYVAARGAPTTLAGHRLIAYEDAVRTGVRHPFLHLPMDGGELGLLSNNHHVLLAGARAGLGIVQLPSYVADACPDLVRILPENEEPYGVWLVVPLANRRIPAVRVTSDVIAETFRTATKASKALNGRSATDARRSPTRARARADRSPRTSHRRR